MNLISIIHKESTKQIISKGFVFLKVNVILSNFFAYYLFLPFESLAALSFRQ